MSDHADHAVAEHDLTDLYVFRMPGDPGRTILIMNADPDVTPGAPSRARRFDPDASYDFMIDTDGDATTDNAFHITFSDDDAGHQKATVVRVAGSDVAIGSGDGQTVLHNAPASSVTESRITVQK